MKHLLNTFGIILSFFLVGCSSSLSSDAQDNSTAAISSSEVTIVEELQSGIQRYSTTEQYTIPNQPNLPPGWTFHIIPYSALEIPLPPSAQIISETGYGFHTMQIKSDEQISMDSDNDFMFYLSYPSDLDRPPEAFRDIGMYFRSICNKSFPAGGGNYTLYYETSNHMIDIYKYYPNCTEEEVAPDGEIMNIRIMVLQYQNRLFQVALMNPKFTNLEGEKLIETAILNIRPIMNE